jgi:monoamine oxidase
MARTLLFRQLQTLLRITAGGANQRPSLDAVLARDEARRLTRRQLLQGGAAASIALAGCGDDAPAATPASVVIVGAGLAGLTAAYRLQQRGMAAEVFEASTRVGGRTLTERARFASKGELGGEYVDMNHTALQAMLRELGLHLTDTRDPSLESQRVFLEGAPRSFAEIFEAFTPITEALTTEVTAFAGATPDYRAATPDALRLDRLSIAAWLDARGLRGVGRSLIEAAYRGEYGRDAADLSMLCLLTLVGDDPSPLNLLGSSDQSFTITEGSDAVASELVRRLRAPVRFEHRLVAVRARPDGRLQVVFDRGGASVERVVSRVVLAIPFTQLRRCELMFEMAPAQRAAVMGLQYGTNTKVLLGMRQRPWRATLRASGNGVCDEVFSETWDSTAGLTTEGGVLTCFSGGRLGVEASMGDVAPQATRAVAQAERLFPGVAAAYADAAMRSQWITSTFAGGSYACYAPGQWTSMHGAEGLTAGGVLFAGEHTSVAFQGFMNGAVASGEDAARAIVGG